MFSIIMPFFERPTLLLTSLRAMQEVYKEISFEVIVIDDASKEELKPQIPKDLPFEVLVVSMLEKNGINPCVPYNIGVSVAQGEFVVLTSPEIVPLRDILQETLGYFTNIGKSIGSNPYLVFDVFGLTDLELNLRLKGTAENLVSDELFQQELKKILESEPMFLKPGEDSKKPWSNSVGAWYHHSRLKPSDLNFLSVMQRSDYIEIGGFCERFRGGTGYDDVEFLDRARRKLKITRVPNLAAVHLDHEEVASRKDFSLPINSNLKMYLFMKSLRLRPKQSFHPFKLSHYPGI